MSPIRPEMTVVGIRVEPEHHRLRDFLTRIAQPHRFLDAGTPEAEVVLAAAGRPDAEDWPRRSTPPSTVCRPPPSNAMCREARHRIPR